MLGLGGPGVPCPASDIGINAPIQTRVLSLAEVRESAFQCNWDLLAAKSGVDMATAQLLAAKEFPNPTASLSTARIGAHESATAMGNSLWQRSYDSIAAVSQLIEIGGKRRDRQIAGRAGVLGAKARFHDAKRTLDQGVTKAYIAALLAAENARVLTESAEFARQEAKIAGERFKAGDLSDADKATLEINAEQLELQAAGAVATEVQARIAVEVLMGVNQPKGNWTPSDTLEKLTDVSAAASAPSDFSASRPDVLAAETDLRGAEAQLRLQKAIRIPDPTFTVGAEHNPPGGGPAEDTFLVGISFPLPVWNQNGSGIKSARAAVEQAGDALGKIRTQAQADIANAESAYIEAHARWLRYRDETAPKSAKVLESIAYKYQKGAAALLDLLNAEQTDNTIRLALAQAMNDTASTVADLAAARATLKETELDLWK
jgi:cobalt-zinc-cadmium efflux system outer membrane protein